MCRLKSGIILKDMIFVPEHDSHTEMLEELGIKDSYLTASKTFVKFELLPKANDVFSNIDTWKLNIDQDIVPDWYDEEVYKPRVIEQVKEWAKTHIHNGIDNLKISSGNNHYIKDCKDVCICDNAMVNCIIGDTTVLSICGSAKVNRICENVTVDHIHDCAMVDCICDNAKITSICDRVSVNHIFDGAMVSYVYGNSFIREICGNAVIENLCGNSMVYTIYDDALVKHIFGSARINNISGNARVNRIYNSAVVGYVSGDAVIDYICDGASIQCVDDNATISRISDMATVVSSNFWQSKNIPTISKDAVFKDCNAKIIYQSGDWKFVGVKSDVANEQDSVMSIYLK